MADKKVIANYEAQLSFDASKFKKGMADSEKDFSTFRNKMKSIGNGIVAGIGVAVAAAGSGAAGITGVAVAAVVAVHLALGSGTGGVAAAVDLSGSAARRGCGIPGGSAALTGGSGIALTIGSGTGAARRSVRASGSCGAGRSRASAGGCGGLVIGRARSGSRSGATSCLSVQLGRCSGEGENQDAGKCDFECGSHGSKFLMVSDSISTCSTSSKGS